jgi:multiple sugar transport system ATP-binding protein
MLFLIYLSRISLRHLTKKFGQVTAVDNVDLEVKDSEFVVLLGPSGCGKTTTLRLIAGLESPTEGEIRIDDKLVNDVPPQKRDLAMVFQSYALYPHMTIYNNIGIPLKIRGIEKGEMNKRVQEVSKLLGIENLLERKPGQLSGGQRQRVALGRAIIREPKAFLMDEPLSNLDAKLRLYMRVELKKLQKDIGITTIYVTHDQAEAMTMADTVALMNFGKIQQLSAPSELYHRPNNLFVASFIGSPPMNFMDCSLVGEYLDAGEYKLKLGKDMLDILKKGSKGSELTLGVRPEHVHVNREKTSENDIKASVYVVEPLGSEAIVDVKIGENIVKAKENPFFKASIGEQVWIAFDGDQVHIFDKKSGDIII